MWLRLPELCHFELYSHRMFHLIHWPRSAITIVLVYLNLWWSETNDFSNFQHHNPFYQHHAPSSLSHQQPTIPAALQIIFRCLWCCHFLESDASKTILIVPRCIVGFSGIERLVPIVSVARLKPLHHRHYHRFVTPQYTAAILLTKRRETQNLLECTRVNTSHTTSAGDYGNGGVTAQVCSTPNKLCMYACLLVCFWHKCVGFSGWWWWSYTAIANAAVTSDLALMHRTKSIW